MKQQPKIRRVSLLLALSSLFFAPFLAIASEMAPSAQTLSPTFVTEKSMQLNGRVNPNEMADTYEWFEWGISGRSAVYETPHTRLWGGNTQMNTSATIVGLAPSTQYFYRQISENGRGKDVGQTAYITTKPLAASFSPVAITATNDAVFIDETSATLRGYVSPHGNSHVQSWFEWGTTATMKNRTSEQGTWGNSGPLEAKLQHLMPGTMYYFRAVSENEEGRSYGALKVFTTSGTPAVLSTEVARAQDVPSPVAASGDTTSRAVTTSGAANAPQAGATGLPQALNRPGDFFSMLFGKKKSTTATEDTAGGSGENNASDAVAGVGAAGALNNLWNTFTGKQPVEVVVEKVGPSNIAVHTAVEYRIAYAYRMDTPASEAKLRITLPAEVIYIGDNTNNELLIETGAGSERTYVLPLGRLEQGKTRTMSILGMTTGDAEGFPDVRVRLEYTNKSGVHVVAATTGGLHDAKKNSAGAGNASRMLLPHSLWGWLCYILAVVGAIFGIRKAKEFYLKRKEALAKTVEQNNFAAVAPEFLPGATEVTRQGV